MTMDGQSSDGFTLHPVKKIEIVVHSEDAGIVQDLMKASHIPGYTVVRDVAGMGHAGFHEGRALFNDRSGLVMFVAVATEQAILSVAKGMRGLFERRSGVMFVSDAHVVRLDYFAPA
jgi:hypothetical protein